MLLTRSSTSWLFKLATLVLLFGFASTAFAEGEGQADLDDAMVKRLDAKSMEALTEVSDLLNAAIEKGLDKENEGFAKQMLSGVALDRGKALAQQMFRQPRGANVQKIRRQAIESLETAVKYDSGLAEAHSLIARLNMLPGGDRERATKAATAAIEALEDEPHEQSKAFMMRALMQESEDKRADDIQAAIDANGENTEAYQARAMLNLQKQDFEQAVEDLKRLLELDPTNTEVAGLAVQTLRELDRIDEAMKILNEGLETTPNATLYALRAEIRRADDKLEEALADLNKAVELVPKNPVALFARAELHLTMGNAKESRRDLDLAMEMAPGSVQGVLLRAYVSAEEGRLPDAINDMKLLVRNQPRNANWGIQLATFYQMDNRPRKAIDVTTDILRRESNNWKALRVRADSRLSIGAHKEAIADYEKALESEITDVSSRSGILNNLAWVLSTSPQDEIRNAEKSIKFGEEAAKLTEYKQAHILSTLAAGYAEAGDFEKAIEWSQKAVDLGKQDEDDLHDQLDQLEKELESYKEGKPWREEQDVEENKAPVFSAEEIIES